MNHATAVTPTLYLGTDLPYPHTVATRLTEALATIDAGARAVLGDAELALQVLLALGAEPAIAERQVHRALHGLTATPKAPTPYATPSTPNGPS